MSLGADPWEVVAHEPDEWGVVSHEPERDHQKELAEASERALTAVEKVSEQARKHAEKAREHAGSAADAAVTFEERLADAMAEVRQISASLNDERRALDGAMNAVAAFARDLHEKHKESMKMIGAALESIAASQRALADAMNRKRRVVRGTDGRVQSMEAV